MQIYVAISAQIAPSTEVDGAILRFLQPPELSDCCKYRRKGGTAVDAKKISKSKFLGISLVLLILCEIASLVVLFERIGRYTETEFKNIIPLTESIGNTKVTISARGTKEFADNPHKSQTISLSSPSFSAYDENTVWQAETDVDIFRISYDNGNGEMTVNGASENSDKLIAPGTSGEYKFALENTGNSTLDYTMDMEAWITGTDFSIPVEARVWEYNGEYLLGDSNSMADVLALNTVKDEGTLGVGRLSAYTLQWEWPFEDNRDEYDTMLGNLAVDNELALTIRINTTASCNDNPEDVESGLESPKTGDNIPIKQMFIIICCLTVISAVCILAGRKCKNEETNE